MDSITIKEKSNEEIKALFDESAPYIFIHKFSPSETITWEKASISLDSKFQIKDTLVRGLTFDLQTDLEELKKIIDLNTRQLRVYQFTKPVADTLDLDALPEDNRLNILKSNGLKHFFWINFEFITIHSSDNNYLISIKE